MRAPKATGCRPRSICLPDMCRGNATPPSSSSTRNARTGCNRYSQPVANGYHPVAVHEQRLRRTLVPTSVITSTTRGCRRCGACCRRLTPPSPTGVVDCRTGRAARPLLGRLPNGDARDPYCHVSLAAAAGAPLTNMISMDGSVYSNTGGANQAMFESSEGRFAGGY